MAKKIYEESNIAAIAEKIRDATGGTETYATSDMADGVAEVYEAGKEAGLSAFIDEYQDYGKRTKYENGFTGIGWKDSTFKPNYNMILGAGYSASGMFKDSKITDVQGTLEKRGIILDTSKSYLLSFAQNALSKRWGVIDASACGSSTFNYAFSGAYCETIDKLIIHENVVTNTGFNNCNNLVNITIEGTIGTNLDIKWSPLSAASMKSIISALKNYVGTDKEYTQKLSFSDTCWAALEADSTSPNGTTWKEYVGSLGWNT